MDAFKNVPKLSSKAEEGETVRAEMSFINVKTTRRLVQDTTTYPFKAVAFMSFVMGEDEDGDENEYAGTGFLCENNVFLTCAHNVRYGKKGRKAAEKVCLNFGQNGEADNNEDQKIPLKGSDFTVPDSYKMEVDDWDIAWIDLNQYYEQKVKEGCSLKWNLTDLPKECFYTCAIPEADGKLDEEFSLCGKSTQYRHLN